jgi:hypothetical protein
MKWYYYQPLSYYRYFIVFEFSQRDVVIEIEINTKLTSIADIECSFQDFDYIDQNHNLKHVSIKNRKKVLSLLEKDASYLFMLLFKKM